MHIPRYYLPQPALQRDATTIAAYEALWTHISTAPAAGELPHSLPVPCWQFLCYLADHKPVLLHGSGNPDLEALVPRQTMDMIAFGNREAVYAASDGLWPIYFAILDRNQYPMSLTNACIRVSTPPGMPGEPFYFFSISYTALQQRPWRTGTVYILPRTTFEAQPPIPYGDSHIHVMQWASLFQVAPIAKHTNGNLWRGPNINSWLDQLQEREIDAQGTCRRDWLWSDQCYLSHKLHAAVRYSRCRRLRRSRSRTRPQTSRGISDRTGLYR